MRRSPACLQHQQSAPKLPLEGTGTRPSGSSSACGHSSYGCWVGARSKYVIRPTGSALLAHSKPRRSGQDRYCSPELHLLQLCCTQWLGMDHQAAHYSRTSPLSLALTPITLSRPLRYDRRSHALLLCRPTPNHQLATRVPQRSNPTPNRARTAAQSRPLQPSRAPLALQHVTTPCINRELFGAADRLAPVCRSVRSAAALAKRFRTMQPALAA